MEPEIVVLDEPTANLDPAGRRELAEVLDRLGHTMLLVTHDLPYALQLCPRSVVINRGSIVADGPTARDPRRPRVDGGQSPGVALRVRPVVHRVSRRT